MFQMSLQVKYSDNFFGSDLFIYIKNLKQTFKPVFEYKITF